MTEITPAYGSAATPNDDELDWQKSDGLLPAIVQHWRDGRVLMLGYMNPEALQRTQASGHVTFYSRSKQRLWTKGESSGNHLQLKSLHVDCDNDTILAMVDPVGPTCHTGTASCFGPDAAPTLSIFGELDAVIAQRHRERPPGSYTTKLFDGELRRIAQKVGEEGVETALAAVTQDEAALAGEAADLIFHLAVLLRARGLDLDAVANILRQRAT
ncbi:MAG: bifunctional phosphoribosyl-AMP cyclohydrolase/phosphoribosyl-ATP diphosphatase HisIE [Dokdonella sp.]